MSAAMPVRPRDGPRPRAARIAIARDRTRPAAVAGEPYVVASPQLAMSPVHRGHRAAISRREALILQAAAQPSRGCCTITSRTWPASSSAMPRPNG